ncbi:hypothetical protein FKG94_12860 [Exilibacterium tricleocarpae]|uniref:Lipoprotein n=1 Tax=Exilibacterium tricleocarpae TaxID=2591008 RepID=A0A545TP03_9GAMM|nr:hypothetical protein [Exilibacterium tricleocarpae]TQV78901.1 hypothetical protein FKG94_12860 [Exilibacterium tricleocarpae]
MFINKFRFFIILLVVTPFMTACRVYNLYQYKPLALDVLGGELIVSLEGTYGENYEKDGKRFADFGAPYNLKFMLSMPYEYDLVEIQIRDIEIVGEKSKRKFFLPDTGSKKIKNPRNRSNPDATARTVIASVGNLSSEDFEYEPYSLTATVVVYASETSFREEEISLRLETDYKRERRSDWFDKNMSI